MNRKIALPCGVALIVALASGSAWLTRRAAAASVAGVEAPRFEVDPLWPKPLPNKWILGQTIGVSVDAQDHIWIIHRAGSLEPGEVHATTTPPTAQCCAPAPPILEFDAAGNLIGHWGGPGPGYDWPDSNHGITVDYKGNVWIAGNGRGKPPTGTQPRETAAGRNQQQDESQAGVNGYFYDNMVLKFTQDGKFLMQIGKPATSKGSNDVGQSPAPGENLHRQADQRSLRRRRLRQPSRHRVRRRNRRLQAALGRLRQQAGRCESGTIRSERAAGAAVPQPGALRRSLGRSTALRLRSRQRSPAGVQAGWHVRQGSVLRKNTLGSGSVWDIAFSKDPQQKYIYLADGENDKVRVLLRDTLEVLTSFGEGGRQPGEFYGVHSIATDSKGNIYTTETYRGQRVQKFVYKGLAPVTSLDQGVVWPKK